MLPSSSSQLARYGQISHYKKFWLLQTQLEKQDQSSTSLSLQGATGNTIIPTVVKENKPLSSSRTVHGDHNTVGHGSCRAVLDIGASSTTSCSTSRGGANFPYPTSIEPSTTTMKFYTNGLCHSLINSGSLRDSPPLSLAVNCENAALRNFVNQSSWSSSPPLQPNFVSDAPLRPPTSAKFLSSHPGKGVPGQVLVSSVTTEDLCESSECSTGGEKRAGYWDISTSFHSCTTTNQITPALYEVPAPSSSLLRSGAYGSASVLRTCSLCGTTKTPLWRSGPDGPKSLCNACGIRVKKSKRLQAAMEAAGGDVQQVGSSSSSPSSSYKRLQLSTTSKSAGRGGALKRKHPIQAAENASDPIYQKRKKMVGYRRSIWSPSSLAELRGSQDGGCFSDAGEGTAKLGAGIVMDRKSSSKDIMSNMFAKDVEEAAVLLMALSCGLVLS